MLAPFNSSDETCRDWLQTANQHVRYVVVQRIAVVQPSVDESLDQGFDGVLRQTLKKRTQLPKLVAEAEACTHIDSWLSKSTPRFRAASRTWTRNDNSDISSVSTLANCCADPSYRRCPNQRGCFCTSKMLDQGDFSLREHLSVWYRIYDTWHIRDGDKLIQLLVNAIKFIYQISQDVVKLRRHHSHL